MPVVGTKHYGYDAAGRKAAAGAAKRSGKPVQMMPAVDAPKAPAAKQGGGGKKKK